MQDDQELKETQLPPTVSSWRGLRRKNQDPFVKQSRSERADSSS